MLSLVDALEKGIRVGGDLRGDAAFIGETNSKAFGLKPVS